MIQQLDESYKKEANKSDLERLQTSTAVPAVSRIRPNNFADIELHHYNHMPEMNASSHGHNVSRNRSASVTSVLSEFDLTFLNDNVVQENANSGQGGNEFINGIMNQGGSGGNEPSLSHSPPAISSSYTDQVLPKRRRAGSISGRLRSASDLSDMGLIDVDTKLLLKDIIISGMSSSDTELQTALDDYERYGTTKKFESMIKNGQLSHNTLQNSITRAGKTKNDKSNGFGAISNNVDLLNDLDFDFLTVSEGTRARGYSFLNPVNTASDNSTGGIQKTNNNASYQIIGSPENVISNNESDDGIGELDFTNFESYDHSHHAAGASTSMFSEQNLSNFNSVTASNNRSRYRDRGNSLASWMSSMGDPLEDVNLGDGSKLESFKHLVESRGTLHMPDDVKSINKPRQQVSNAVVAGTDYRFTSTERRMKTASTHADSTKHNKNFEKPSIPVVANPSTLQRKKRQGRPPKSHLNNKPNASSLKSKPRASQRRSSSPPHTRKQKINTKPTQLMRRHSDPTDLSENNSIFSHLWINADDRPESYVGAYSPEARKARISRFMDKRKHRVWTKKVKYDVRKNFADSRLRVKGRFVKKEDEMLMRDLMSIT